MEGSIPAQSRLGVEDKRHLFQALLAMLERLFYLNEFPVDQADFALSLQTPEVEDAWQLLRNTSKASLAPNHTQYFTCFDNKWMLHVYPSDSHDGRAIFMDVKTIDIENARRHLNVVNLWCNKQKRLEEQILRAAHVIKCLVHSCNTVGQYKRVSPDLLGFLPAKYREALGHYTKKSPYPDMSIEPKEIDTTLATLAYAALRPAHPSEENYTTRPYWHHNRYNLEDFPRSKSYSGQDVRRLEL